MTLSSCCISREFHYYWFCLALNMLQEWLPDIRQVARMYNGDLKIDVIESFTSSPIFVVTQFCGTLVMNYITQKGVCIIGLVSPCQRPLHGAR